MDSRRSDVLVKQFCFYIFPFILFFLFFTSKALPADSKQNLDNVDIYLLTVSDGDALYTRFGHSILRIVDREARKDYSYNWGTFSFDEPGFAFKFFKGVLIYRMDRMSFPAVIRFYRDHEKRSVWQDKVDLTNSQKQILLDRIAWNIKPENVKYLYQYFSNNCSTKIRDYLDEALNGKIREYTATADAGITYRDHVRSHLATIPFVVMGLDIFMNSRIDRKISTWEEMFLPAKMREYLLAIPSFNDAGEPREGSHLLSDSQTLVALPPVQTQGKNNSYIVLALLLMIPCLVVIGSRVSTSNLRFPSEKVRSIILGLTGIAWGGFSGFLGLVMLLSWSFSEHLDLHHNVNLLTFWPIDWLLIPAGWGYLKSFKKLPKKSRFQAFMQYFYLGHLVTCVVLAMIFLTGFVEQDISRVCMFTLVPQLLLYATFFNESKKYGA